MKYKAKLKISEKELNYYNELLSLDLDECLPYYNKNDIERLNARIDDYIEIARVDFENGNYLLIDIASGSSNYYDNIVLYDKYDNELYVFDCEYKIDSFNFEYENNMYSLEIEKVKESD